MTRNKTDRKGRDHADDGQFKHQGGHERLCTCGHTLGVHAAHKAAGERPCFYGDISGGDCNCTVFRPAKKSARTT